MHDGPSLAGSEPPPEQADPPGMGSCGHKNHSAGFPARKCSCSDLDFVGGIHDGRFEDVNRVRRHSFVNQNAGVVIISPAKGMPISSRVSPGSVE